MHVKRCLFFGGLLVAAGSVAMAADPVLCQGQILIDPLSSTIVNTAHCPEMKPTYPALKSSNRFSISPREVVTMGVAKANPLVFTYKWNGIKLSETPDFQAATALVAALKPIAGVYGLDGSSSSALAAQRDGAANTLDSAEKEVQAAEQNEQASRAKSDKAQKDHEAASQTLKTARAAEESAITEANQQNGKAELRSVAEAASKARATAEAAQAAAVSRLAAAAQEWRTAMEKLQAARDRAAKARAAALAATEDSFLSQIEAPELRSAVKATGLTYGVLRETQKAIEDLRNNAAAIPNLVRDSLKEAKLADTKQKVAAWSLDEKEKTLNGGLTLIGKAQSGIDEVVLKYPDDRKSEAWLWTALDHVSGQGATAQKLLEEERKFAATMAKVGDTITFGDTVSYDAAHFAEVSISVGYADGGADVLKEVLPGKVDKATGTFSVTFEPYNKVTLRLGVSGVYVFSKDAAGQTIGLRPVVLLAVSPTGWADYLLTPHLEFGFTPEKDKIGIYFGGGLEIKAALKLVGGFTLQQRKTGDNSSYKPGGYLGLALTPAGKK